MTSPNGSPKQHRSKINIIRRLDTKTTCMFNLKHPYRYEDLKFLYTSHAMLICVSQYAPQKMPAKASPFSPPTFSVDILFLLLHSNLYEGLRSFVLVLWMQRQCPVNDGTSHSCISFLTCHRIWTVIPHALTLLTQQSLLSFETCIKIHQITGMRVLWDLVKCMCDDFFRDCFSKKELLSDSDIIVVINNVYPLK